MSQSVSVKKGLIHSSSQAQIIPGCCSESPDPWKGSVGNDACSM